MSNAKYVELTHQMVVELGEVIDNNQRLMVNSDMPGNEVMSVITSAITTLIAVLTVDLPRDKKEVLMSVMTNTVLYNNLKELDK